MLLNDKAELNFQNCWAEYFKHARNKITYKCIKHFLNKLSCVQFHDALKDLQVFLHQPK